MSNATIVSRSRYLENEALRAATCGSLVLGFREEQPIQFYHGRGYYIPSSDTLQELLGYSLRKICGEKNGSCHWADSVRWETVEDLSKLRKRVVKGLQEVTGAIGEENSELDDYLSCVGNPLFDHQWFFGKGDSFRFLDGKRKEVERLVRDYWNEGELIDFERIHRQIRVRLRE